MAPIHQIGPINLSLKLNPIFPRVNIIFFFNLKIIVQFWYMAFVVVFFFFFTFTSSDWFVPHSRPTCGDMASDRTQRFHIRTAKQVVDTALAETAPKDAENLWVFLVQSQIVAQQTNDEAIDFKLSSRCACRILQERRTLGITKRNLIY